MSLASFADYIGNTNTMKNPLDTIFPNTRKKITGQNPPKIVKEPIVSKTQEAIQNVKEGITDVKAKITPVVFFGIIAFLVYTFAKKK
jgi:hypothetical protein